MRIDELRSTLEGHADTAGSGDALDRVGSVRARVATVRRRRRTAVSAVAVVALAVGTVGVVPMLRDRPPGPAQAPEQLAGLTVPRTETATGFTYRYVRGVESEPGDEALRLGLARTDEPYLVMWASSDRDPDLRLRDRAHDINERSLTPGFERFTYLPGDVAHELVLRGVDAPGDARLAMAVFERVEEPPPGVSNGETTYRERVAEQPLLGAAIGEPGDSRIAFDFTAPEGGVSIFPICYGGEARRHLVLVEIDGRPAGGVGCGRAPYYDPPTGGSSFRNALRRAVPGETVRVTAHLADLPTERRVQDPATVIGVGVYAESPQTRVVAGWRIPPVLEEGGHEYVVDTVRESEPGQREVTLRLRPSDVPRMVTAMVTGKGSGSFTTMLLRDGKPSHERSMTTGEPSSMQSGYILQPGESPVLTYRVTQGRLDQVQVGMVLSTLVH